MGVLMAVKDIEMYVEETEDTETCNCISDLKNTQVGGLGKCRTFLSGSTQVRKRTGNGRKDWQDDCKLSRNRRY